MEPFVFKLTASKPAPRGEATVRTGEARTPAALPLAACSLVRLLSPVGAPPSQAGLDELTTSLRQFTDGTGLRTNLQLNGVNIDVERMAS